MFQKKDLNKAAKTIQEFIENAKKVEEHLSNREETEKLREGEDNKEKYSEKMIDFVKAKNKSGEISQPDYIFRASFYVITIHEDRWLNQQYRNDLDPISQKIENIERENGLDKDQYWKLDEGPKEWQKLNQEYNKILESKLVDVFKEFDLNEIANLIEDDKEEYDRLYEAGRKNTFNTKSEIEKLSLIVEKYKREAQIAEQNDAYFATTVFSGAAIEALLLKEVLKKPDQVDEIINAMPKRKKPTSDPKRWGLSDLINIANKAEWLTSIQIENNFYLLDQLAHAVRLFRNFLHPGRILREMSTVGIEKSQAELASSILFILNYVIENIEE